MLVYAGFTGIPPTELIDKGSFGVNYSQAIKCGSTTKIRFFEKEWFKSPMWSFQSKHDTIYAATDDDEVVLIFRELGGISKNTAHDSLIAEPHLLPGLKHHEWPQQMAVIGYAGDVFTL